MIHALWTIFKVCMYICIYVRRSVLSYKATKLNKTQYYIHGVQIHTLSAGSYLFSLSLKCIGSYKWEIIVVISTEIIMFLINRSKFG